MADLFYYVRELASQGITADVAENPDSSIELRMPEGSTTEQIAAGEAALAAIIESAPLKNAKASKMQALDLWYLQQTQSGITVSGFILDASIESQNRIDSLVTMILAALTVGAATAETPFTAYEMNGTAIELPAGQLIGLMIQYATVLSALSGSYGACKAAIGAALTVEAVNEVPLPS